MKTTQLTKLIADDGMILTDGTQFLHAVILREGMVEEDWTEITEEEARKRQIAELKLTRREVFLGIYKAKQVTPEQIRAQITDTEALIEFDYASDYYRGNPLISSVGATLGFTEEQLDNFFLTKDYTTLL